MKEPLPDNTKFVTVVAIADIVPPGQFAVRAYIGSTYRCPVDEAYTLVNIGKATYPGGIEILDKMVHGMTNQEIEDIRTRLNSLESYLNFLEKCKILDNMGQNILRKLSDNWKLIFTILAIASSVMTVYPFGKQLHWWP